MIAEKTLQEEYHEFLLDIIGFDLPEHRKYMRLIEDLNDKEFFWVHPMDENRDIDALYLRKEYLVETGRDISLVWDTPRSCFEVLVTFSRRIEIEITGEPGNDDLGRWFWIMLKNLDILYSDDHYDHGLVQFKLDVWLTRKYQEDGKGGIFPLKNAINDQTKTDMWYQMQGYLNENFEI